MSEDIGASGLQGGGYDYEWKGVRRIWRVPETTMRQLDKDGHIFYTRNGIPRRKRYLDESKGMPAQDIWSDIQPLRSWHQERLGYPTQKPVSLLERMIQASSNPGDVVLDPFCGCGTTIDAAHKLGRTWIGIDITVFDSVIISVKAGKTGASHIRDLKGVLEREKAAIDVLISMQEPTQPMETEAVTAGFYESQVWGRNYSKIQLLTVEEILNGKAIDMPPILQVSATFKKAPRSITKQGNQMELSV